MEKHGGPPAPHGGQKAGIFLLHQPYGPEDYGGKGEDKGEVRCDLGSDESGGTGHGDRRRAAGSADPGSVRDAPGGARRAGLLPETAPPDRTEDRALRRRGACVRVVRG